MRECFRLARRGTGHVSPNPLVGAVLVRRGKVIASGYHHRFGAAHAEVDCLRRARGRSRGATLYVNLEPCSHFGKTPPCTDAIVQCGVGRVVVGMKDPNPRIAGRGIRKLRSAGIEVSVGILGDEARALNRVFATHISLGRPYVLLKIAQSADGFISGGPGAGPWITSLSSRELVHRWRAEFDAVLVGAGTIHADNPRLTTRLVHGRDPDVVILDGTLSLSKGANVFSAGRARRVIVCTTTRAVHQQPARATALAAAGALVLAFDSKSHEVRLRTMLKRLYQLRIGSVMVEGGQRVFTQFLGTGPVDETSLFIAPRLLMNGTPSVEPGASVRRLFDARTLTLRPVGDDVLINTIWGET